MRSFLMAGQSNMAGRGDIGEVDAIYNSHCFMLRNGLWQIMSEPINPDRPIFSNPNIPASHYSGISLTASFADEYAKYTGLDVGLIPCAHGGTTILEWQKGEILFDNAISQAKLAMRTSELVGILWHQGESDCESQTDADNYYERLMTVLTSFRDELGEVPIIMGELGYIEKYKNGVAKYRNEVNAQIHRAAKTLPNCGIVSSSDLVNRSDNLHFNAASLREFGKRYFEKYKEIAGI